MFLQSMKRCSPEGRMCIERNSMNSFNCNVTCKGIYADVQWFNGTEEETRGNPKYLKLISEYQKFKENAVQHFKFDPSNNSVMFRK